MRDFIAYFLLLFGCKHIIGNEYCLWTSKSGLNCNGSFLNCAVIMIQVAADLYGVSCSLTMMTLGLGIIDVRLSKKARIFLKMVIKTRDLFSSSFQ
ncbi:MAG TPA: hypothetical protein DIT98_13345 [Verrucomicrobiales bacterium]|nr:hypothetical protein [Verrucomicrobiales bacterium]